MHTFSNTKFEGAKLTLMDQPASVTHPGDLSPTSIGNHHPVENATVNHVATLLEKHFSSSSSGNQKNRVTIVLPLYCSIEKYTLSPN